MLADRWIVGSGATRPAQTEQTSTPPQAETASPSESPSRPRTISRPFLVRPVELFTAKDPQAEQRYREQQSKGLLHLLRFQLGAAELRYPSSPEAAANEISVYMHAWADTVVRTAPDLVDELASQIELTMCDPQARPAQLIVMSRVIGKMPELANAHSFECLFTQHPQEDIVLWSALDAWRAAGRPKSAAIARIEQTASDSRTRQRLKSPEEQRELTAAEETAAETSEISATE
jgi:hypothetical protein